MVEQAVALIVRLQKELKTAAQLGIGSAGAIEKGLPFLGRAFLERFQEDVPFFHKFLPNETQ